MLETVLLTFTTAHITFPPPSGAQLGFPTVVCPSRLNPLHEVPLYTSTQSALSGTPKTPHISWLAALLTQAPLAPTTRQDYRHSILSSLPQPRLRR